MSKQQILLSLAIILGVGVLLWFVFARPARAWYIHQSPSPTPSATSYVSPTPEASPSPTPCIVYEEAWKDDVPCPSDSPTASPSATPEPSSPPQEDHSDEGCKTHDCSGNINMSNPQLSAPNYVTAPGVKLGPPSMGPK